MGNESASPHNLHDKLPTVSVHRIKYTMADQPPEQSKSALKKAEKHAKMAAEKAAKAAKQATLAVGQGKKTDDIIGITTKKEEDFAAWYQEVVLKAEMIEYYNEVIEPEMFFLLRIRGRTQTDRSG